MRNCCLWAVNGIGIGHVIRCSKIGLLLKDEGYNVSLVVESEKEHDLSNLPFKSYSISRCPNKGGYNVGKYIKQFDELINLIDPDIIVFDRHEVANDLLTNRPIVRFRHLVSINSMTSKLLTKRILVRNDVHDTIFLHSMKEVRHLFDSDLISQIETAENIHFSGGGVLGPTLLYPKLEDCSDLPKDYIMVILGGGGEHSKYRDMRTFTLELNKVLNHVKEKYKLSIILICGPNFNYESLLNRGIKVIRWTNELLKIASGSKLIIARPGFNLSRELYPVCRPIIYFKSYQYEEASEQNLRLLSRREATRISELDADQMNKLIDELIDQKDIAKPTPLWSDGSHFILKFLNSLTTQKVSKRSIDLLKQYKKPLNLCFRIDDVTDLSEELRWLLLELINRKFKVSLEIIPAHFTITEMELMQFDDEMNFIEVSQHGYSHFLSSSSPIKSEFKSQQYPTEDEIDNLLTGQKLLKEEFGERFSHGYSSPFDETPLWLFDKGCDLGFKYISTIWNFPPNSNTPLIKAQCDTFNWNLKRLKPLSSLSYEIDNVLVSGSNHIAFVLHPQHFSNVLDKEWFVNFLELIESLDLNPLKMSDINSNEQTTYTTSKTREYSIFR